MRSLLGRSSSRRKKEPGTNSGPSDQALIAAGESDSEPGLVSASELRVAHNSALMEFFRRPTESNKAVDKNGKNGLN